MKFKSYLYPKTISEAASLLSNKNELNFLNAGGTDLLGMIKEKIISPDNVINLKAVSGLNTITENSHGDINIGALTTISEIIENKLIANKFSVLLMAASEIASPQLRNIGTVGGNLCQRPRCAYFRGEFNCLRKGGDTCYAYDGFNKYHCVVNGSPCFIVSPSDLAPALISLGAFITIFSNGKEKEIPLKDFYILPSYNYLKETILDKGDIVTKIRIPAHSKNIKSTYIKIKERNAWDFAIVSVAAVLELNGTTITNGNLVFGGAAPAPYSSSRINQGLAGIDIKDEKVVSAYANSAIQEVNPLAMNDYKTIMMKNIIIKALSSFI